MDTVLNLLQSGAPSAVARLMRLIEITMETILYATLMHDFKLESQV
jgi:hypothetical protein